MIKYLLMDVDGTLTDGKIYMGKDEEYIKAFSVKDGYAINHILKSQNIIPIVITARTSAIVQKRCSELGINKIYQGKENKLDIFKHIVSEADFDKCAYFGDDILDLESMLFIKKAKGVVGCPADAVQEVKAAADYICHSKAGEGALREFVEWIIKPKINNRILDSQIEKAVAYLKNLTITSSDIGKHIVDENFYYDVQEYVTKFEEDCALESHKNCIDVQIMIEGNEAMDIVDVSRLSVREEYDAKKDVMYWNIPSRMARVRLGPGDYVVLYPENAHRGAVALEKCERVLKIVGKIDIGQA